MYSPFCLFKLEVLSLLPAHSPVKIQFAQLGHRLEPQPLVLRVSQGVQGRLVEILENKWHNSTRAQTTKTNISMNIIITLLHQHNLKQEHQHQHEYPLEHEDEKDLKQLHLLGGGDVVQDGVDGLLAVVPRHGRLDVGQQLLVPGGHPWDSV